MIAFKKFFISPQRRLIGYVIVALILGALLFHAGVVVGRRSHILSHRDWSFRAPGFGELHVPHSFIPEGHGVVGTIGAVSSSSLTVTTRDGSTETVFLKSTTLVHTELGTASTSALTAGEHVVVIGIPQRSGVTADFIRVLPGTTSARNMPSPR